MPHRHIDLRVELFSVENGASVSDEEFGH